MKTQQLMHSADLSVVSDVRNSLNFGKSKARMMLVKNPAGYNQVINQISNDEEECKIAFLLNDRYADGTDISWIWDVDFEALARQSARFTRILVSGVRADDMALRLKYAGFDTGRIEVIRDYENLLESNRSG